MSSCFYCFSCKQKESLSQKELETEAPPKHVIEELEAKSKQVQFLETQVKDLEQKLQLGDAKSKEKVGNFFFF